MKIFNLFKRRKEPKTEFMTEEIFKDKFGNRWFQFKEKMNIPARRAIAAEVATRFADLNLTKATLKELIEQMKDNANKGEIVSLFGILQEIEFRLDYVGEEQTLIELAVTYFLLNDEDPKIIDERTKQKKLEILEADQEAKDFFLQAAFDCTTIYSNTSPVDIVDYLTKNGVNTARIDKFIRQRSSTNISTI